jgi:hypothetical protein
MTSKLFLALVLCVSLVPGAYAKGHGNGGDKHHGRDDDRHADRDNHDRDHDHDRDDDKRPAGWDKGKKKGWGDCDVPPGQAKKVGCHPDSHYHVVHHDRDHDRDRDHHAYNRDRDRDHHASVVKPAQSTTTTTVKKTTTTKVPAQTREQARRTNGKVFNDDGTWHYGSSQTTTATKK